MEGPTPMSMDVALEFALGCHKGISNSVISTSVSYTYISKNLHRGEEREHMSSFPERRNKM